MKNNTMMTVLVLVVIVLGGFVVYGWMTEPRPMEERMDDAMHNIGEGNFGEAIDDMDNRTPAEEMGDDIEDAADNMQEEMNNPQ